eukprot:CAMPEP_0203744246 /NCGR_PEP_ID=MMETSP0098-20131031/385_1 /ASSEMBLY_ACC=CAM_ASM_000208 /TAXON_ID=96639 /ORGANISM=" , Strain NY0313808BC1" /LENGTH=160 /DNA_ID=CAMNT_0050631715 /DNA_START=482 /DNA_END=961 /DNA_ORIENTATION=+
MIKFIFAAITLKAVLAQNTHNVTLGVGCPNISELKALNGYLDLTYRSEFYGNCNPKDMGCVVKRVMSRQLPKDLVPNFCADTTVNNFRTNYSGCFITMQEIVDDIKSHIPTAGENQVMNAVQAFCQVNKQICDHRITIGNLLNVSYDIVCGTNYSGIAPA